MACVSSGLGVAAKAATWSPSWRGPVFRSPERFCGSASSRPSTAARPPEGAISRRWYGGSNPRPESIADFRRVDAKLTRTCSEQVAEYLLIISQIGATSSAQNFRNRNHDDTWMLPSLNVSGANAACATVFSIAVMRSRTPSNQNLHSSRGSAVDAWMKARLTHGSIVSNSALRSLSQSPRPPVPATLRISLRTRGSDVA